MTRVTIQMIAEYAGVSRGTVDRVLHDRPNVSPDIKERIMQIIQTSGYAAQMAQSAGLKKSIGILLPGNGWFYADLKREWLRGVNDARQMIEPLGFEVEVVECETDLPYEFAEKIELLRAHGLDGLAISSKNNPAIRKLIDGMVQDGIPVLTYNSDIPGSRRLCFVGQDLHRSGKVAADLICKFAGRQGEILVVAGNLEIDAHRQRVNGFMEKCVGEGIGADRLTLVESFNEYVLTYEKVREQLEQKPSLRAIYMANESVAACAEAIARSDRRGKIMVVGNDLTAPTRKLLVEGTVDFIIEQNVYWQGYEPVMLLKKYIMAPNGSVEPFLFTNISVINSENM